MAESLASELILKLGVLFAKEVEQEVRMVAGVGKAVEGIKSKLQSIQALLADAEKRQFKEQAVKLWLWKLNDAAYDVEDLLEDWNMALQIPARFENPCISSVCFGFRQVKVRHDIAKKIKEMNGRLEQITTDRIRYTLSSTAEEPERLKTTSFDADESTICGRDYEKTTLVEKLCEISKEERGVEVISIVGMGGVGKTTLAQTAFNDDLVSSHFPRRIWVCVSDPFDPINLARAIVESLTGTTSNSLELQTSLEYVSRSIRGEKFLLVLDDVWNEDERKWEPLKNALKYGAKGSAILVTTRNVIVSDKMEAIFKLSLNVLSDEECWSIFSRIAFCGENNNKEDIVEIGWGIVKKCKGLPLAARILGGLLRFKDIKDEWQQVLDSELWQVDEAMSGLSPYLLLSYYDLPSPLKRCFSCCAIFPKDYEIEKNMLIGLWASQGLLSPRQNMDMEVIGERYFNMLLARSLFIDVQTVEIEHLRITLKMHDIVHDFVQYLVENETVHIEMSRHIKIDSRPTTSLFRKAHLAFTLGGENGTLFQVADVIKDSPIDISHTRALLIWPSFHFNGQLKHFKYLRSIIARNMPLKRIPDEIGQLWHLRYLDLSDCESLEELPETLCDLCNLQILNLRECIALQKLPDGIGRLAKLRHLIIDRTHSLDALPREVTRLTALRSLTKFIVSNDNHEGSNIGDLKNFVHLRGFIQLTFLSLVIDKAEAQTAKLNLMLQIFHLIMDFDQPSYVGSETEESSQHFDVIGGLVPPPQVEYLRIYGYRGLIFPDWVVTLAHLKTLILRYCWKCEVLPPLGLLPSLVSLQLREFPAVKEVGLEFLGTGEGIAFPKLENLVMIGMTNWENWEDPDMRIITIMPCLRLLQLSVCPKLKSLPCFLEAVSLDQLIVEFCNKNVVISAKSMSHVRSIVINEDDEDEDDAP